MHSTAKCDHHGVRANSCLPYRITSLLHRYRAFKPRSVQVVGMGSRNEWVASLSNSPHGLYSCIWYLVRGEGRLGRSNTVANTRYPTAWLWEDKIPYCTVLRYAEYRLLTRYRGYHLLHLLFILQVAWPRNARAKLMTMDLELPKLRISLSSQQAPLRLKRLRRSTTYRTWCLRKNR